MSTLDHIADLRAQAEAAIAEAATTERLEELRVQWLGRKAELPNLLRTVAELPPEERGAVGRAANEARQAIDALDRGDRRRGSPRPSSSSASSATASTSRCPARRRSPSAACTCSPRRGARSRTSSSAWASGARGAGGRERLQQLRRAEPQPGAPRAGADRHVLHGRRRGAAHPHVADADPRDGGVSRRRSTSSSRAAPTGATTTRRTRRSSTRSRASRSTRTSRSPT